MMAGLFTMITRHSNEEEEHINVTDIKITVRSNDVDEYLWLWPYKRLLDSVLQKCVPVCGWNSPMTDRTRQSRKLSQNLGKQPFRNAPSNRPRRKIHHVESSLVHDCHVHRIQDVVGHRTNATVPIWKRHG
jgi:hypothetical protein